MAKKLLSRWATRCSVRPWCHLRNLWRIPFLSSSALWSSHGIPWPSVVSCWRIPDSVCHHSAIIGTACVCLDFLLLSLQCDLTHFNLSVSSKILFLNKVTFLSTKIQDCSEGQGHHLTPDKPPTLLRSKLARNFQSSW